MKETEDDTNIWKDILCPFHSKQSADSMQTLSRVPMVFFHSDRINNPKIYIEPQKTPDNQSNLEQEEQSQRPHTS